ncbi:MAG: Uma2 family endonuclease [Elainellaceae cyanobacterium]
MTAQILRKKFTVDQYHQMVAAGILAEGDRVELLAGEIIEMSPVGRQHAACVDRLTELLVMAFTPAATVRVQSPIHLSKSSEPQPDVALLRRRDDFYAQGHPQPEDVLAVVEVSDTTVAFDRSVKLLLYARHGIAEVWIVDLNGGAVEVYREPSGSGYQQVQRFGKGEAIAFQRFGERAIAVEEILG